METVDQRERVTQKTPEETLGETQGETLVKTTQEITQEITQEKTTQEKILVLLQENPSITRELLAERIGITSDGIKYHLDKLKSSGQIRHVGSTKAGTWEVLK